MNEISRRTAMFSRQSLANVDLAVDATAQARLADIKIDAVVADPENPRRCFKPDRLAAMAESIQANGLLQPIVVRPGEGGNFILIAGERRWRAAQLAGFATIKAIIRPSLVDASAILLAQMAENEAREDLTAADLVQGVARLVGLGIPKKAIASALATDPFRIARIHALSELPPDLEPLLASMKIEPLYELLQQHKRDPDAVRSLLASDPVPTRTAIRNLGHGNDREAGEGDTGLSIVQETSGEHGLAPAQVSDAPPGSPRGRTEEPLAQSMASAGVQLFVRHEQHGEGRVIASSSIISNRLPIMFRGSDTPVQVLLAELHIVSIR